MKDKNTLMVFSIFNYEDDTEKAAADLVMNCVTHLIAAPSFILFIPRAYLNVIMKFIVDTGHFC